ncbi:MAG: hypothetical protein M3Y87_11065 [Myxococcota bacterium]|nr:hypothetical protein [Myxococcota bacterium]
MRVVPLFAFDARRAALLLGAWTITSALAIVGGARFVVSERIAPSLAIAAGGGIALGLAVGIVWILTRARSLRYRLELFDARARIVSPEGSTCGDTSDGSLEITRINYTLPRPASAGGPSVRPGFQLRHLSGDHLVGTLFPDSAWETAGHDARLPEFELRRDDFAALRAHVAAGSASEA